MTSPSWGRLDPFGIAEVAGFRDAEDVLAELMLAVASLADGDGRVLQGEPSPLVAAFEARLHRSYQVGDAGAAGHAADAAHAGPDAGPHAADAAVDASHQPAPPPLLVAALGAWGLDLAGRWVLAVALAWELSAKLHAELSATVGRPALTIDGLARLLGDGDLEATLHISRALDVLQRFELIAFDPSGPWVQRGVRATEAALRLAMAASPAELWAPARRRLALPCDPRLLTALHPAYAGPPLLLRGDGPTALAALEEAAAELGTPILLGGPGRARSLGAALRDALACALPVILCIDSPDDWALAHRFAWLSRTFLVLHEPSAAAGAPGYELLELP